MASSSQPKPTSSERQGKVAIVAGCNGSFGAPVCDYLLSRPDSEWSAVLGVGHHADNINRASDPRFRLLVCDLGDEEHARRVFKATELKTVTHAFFGAYAHSPPAEDRDFNQYNADLFANFLHNLASAAPNLEHFHLNTGSKYYGVHLGALPTPITEDAPRHPGRNFYFDQEDLLARKQHGQSWTYSITRPNDILGFGTKRGMNQACTVAAYGVLCRESGRPFKFPGSLRAWQARLDSCSGAVLAQFTVQLSCQLPSSPGAQGEHCAFNIANGDVYSWCQLWPQLAEYFGVKWEGPSESEAANRAPFGDDIPDKQQLWSTVINKYGLKDYPLDSLATWQFADFILQREWDVDLDLQRARQSGWKGGRPTLEVYRDIFREMEQAKAIPTYR